MHYLNVKLAYEIGNLYKLTPPLGASRSFNHKMFCG